MFLGLPWASDLEEGPPSSNPDREFTCDLHDVRGMASYLIFLIGEADSDHPKTPPPKKHQTSPSPDTPCLLYMPPLTDPSGTSPGRFSAVTGSLMGRVWDQT